jgi:hypothetical protein
VYVVVLVSDPVEILPDAPCVPEIEPPEIETDVQFEVLHESVVLDPEVTVFCAALNESTVQALAVFTETVVLRDGAEPVAFDALIV